MITSRRVAKGEAEGEKKEKEEEEEEEEKASEEAEGKGGRGKRVGSRLERAARGQVATRNQGTSEPPSSHARNLQLPPRDIQTLLGPMAGKRASRSTHPRKTHPRVTLCWCVAVCACTRFHVYPKRSPRYRNAYTAVRKCQQICPELTRSNWEITIRIF